MKKKSNFIVAILIIFLFCIGCKKEEVVPEDTSTGGTNTATADTISNHLLFLKSIKKQGNSPAGSAAGNLQFSIKDTLRFATSLLIPIRFLHMDTSYNVAGVWIQIIAGSASASGSYYYEVPEVEEMENSDTISVIMIGINPEGLQLPQSFQIEITAYDKDKRPLAEKTIPAKLDEPVMDLPGNNCGLTLQTGEYWDWMQTNTPAENAGFAFINTPGQIFGSSGADIEGSCCNGKSRWPEFCVGENQHNRTLHFSTYYTIRYENFAFYNDGIFVRSTLEDSPVPLPEESDFCSSGNGKLRESPKMTFYEGTWEIVPANLPANAPSFLKHATHQLRMTGTSSTGTGYGNPGGIIHQLDCKNGFLTLAQITGENASRPLMKFYYRRSIGDKKWWEF